MTKHPRRLGFEVVPGIGAHKLAAVVRSVRKVQIELYSCFNVSDVSLAIAEDKVEFTDCSSAFVELFATVNQFPVRLLFYVSLNQTFKVFAHSVTHLMLLRKGVQVMLVAAKLSGFCDCRSRNK